MLMDATRKVKKVNSMTASTILLWFQSAYVLRKKKYSENMPDAIFRPASILFSVRQLPRFSFGVKFRYRSVMRNIKGRYRVTIYRPFTLLQCD